MRFILSRTDDCEVHSKKWIVGYALLFYVITRIIAMAIVTGCVALYTANGIDPEKLTMFGGSPAAHTFSLKAVVVMLIAAPIMEEGLFRLGLSFKKWQVALGFALILLEVLWSNLNHYGPVGYIVCIASAMVVFFLIFRLLPQPWLSFLKRHYLVAFMWLTSVAFGLLHLMAFSNLTWQLLPYCLCITLIPFFGGCAMAYLRVNLGFWWAVGLHVLNNIPPVLIMMMQ